LKATLCAAAVLVLLAPGCGGGSSPSQPSSPSPSPPTLADPEPLKGAAQAVGKLLGTAIQTGYLAEAPYAATLSKHFNYVTAEYQMKWDPIQRQPGVYDFAASDQIVGFAESQGMRVRGHALVWHGATPAWVGTLSPPELRIAVEDYIRTVAGRYRGRLWAWDVVNEAIDDSQSGLRSTVFSRGLGSDYVAEAFRLARQADPGAELVYNDYGGEGLNRKSNDVYNLVRDLKQRGLVDGGGLQMRVSATGLPAVADIAANIRRLAALGLQVNISEMDVR
jgi:endo-1,4-beta-xylanase